MSPPALWPIATVVAVEAVEVEQLCPMDQPRFLPEVPLVPIEQGEPPTLLLSGVPIEIGF